MKKYVYILTKQTKIDGQEKIAHMICPSQEWAKMKIWKAKQVLPEVGYNIVVDKEAVIRFEKKDEVIVYKYKRIKMGVEFEF